MVDITGSIYKSTNPFWNDKGVNPKTSEDVSAAICKRAKAAERNDIEVYYQRARIDLGEDA